MRIRLEGVHHEGAYYRVEMADGEISYAYGLQNIKQRIKESDEPVILEDCLGFEEHRKLTAFLKRRSKKR